MDNCSQQLHTSCHIQTSPAAKRRHSQAFSHGDGWRGGQGDQPLFTREDWLTGIHYDCFFIFLHAAKNIFLEVKNRPADLQQIHFNSIFISLWIYFHFQVFFNMTLESTWIWMSQLQDWLFNNSTVWYI